MTPLLRRITLGSLGCTATLLLHPKLASSEPSPRSSSSKAAFTNALEILRKRRDELHSKWDYENKHSRLPTISWPEEFPELEEMPAFREKLAACSAKLAAFKSRSSSFWMRSCADLQFQVATALVTIQPDSHSVREGGVLLQDLAEMDYPDGIVGFALCLVEEKGGFEEDLPRAIKLLERAVDVHEHAHGAYELGVMHYQGIGLDEDESKAMQLFRSAATKGHCGAMYMFGDCLLEGIGTEEDKVQALQWLLLAGENGHRGARSRLLALLDDDGTVDHGLYTDASRQSYRRRKTKLERRMTVQQSRR